jgi:hypothetical protein
VVPDADGEQEPPPSTFSREHGFRDGRPDRGGLEVVELYPHADGRRPAGGVRQRALASSTKATTQVASTGTSPERCDGGTVLAHGQLDLRARFDLHGR